MTGQRSGTIVLLSVGVVYALLFGGWLIATSPDQTPAVLPTVASTAATAATAPPTAVPAGYQGRIPTPGLPRPPSTLESEPTPAP